MPTAPPVLTDPGLSPDRSDRATFSTRSVARDDFIKNIEIPERRLALANVYANALEAAAAAALAVPASTAALAAANYKGLWTSLAGALNIPASVFHSSAFWILKNNLANVATSQPGVSADWINGGQISGGRRKNINGDFSVNQLALTSPVTLAAGQYGHDGYKGGAAGCTYSFTTANNATSFTVTAGTLLQVLDGAKLQSGTHTASWIGTCQGRWGAGIYGASGIQGTVVGGTNINIEFGIGTLSFVQAEPGTVATSFEFKDNELGLCQRYVRPLPTVGCPGLVVGVSSAYFISTGLPMRSTPTLSTGAGHSLYSAFGVTVGMTTLGVFGFAADGTVFLATSTSSGLTAGNSTMLSAASGSYLTAAL